MSYNDIRRTTRIVKINDKAIGGSNDILIQSMTNTETADYEATIFGAGYDHNWCLNNNGEFAKVAELYSDVSGIRMEVYTDLPGVQVYTGNFINNETGKGGVVYQRRQGVCFETQAFPNSLKFSHFPGAILKKGEKYDTVTAYRFI